jgi:CheY-like chemotaxis protein
LSDITSNRHADPIGSVAPNNGGTFGPLKTSETRLLIVDDDRDSADALSMVMEGYGYQVAVAYRNVEALRQFEAFQPDVSLFDLSTPEPDGFALARSIRSGGRKAVLLAFTGYAQAEDIQAAEDAGFDRHFSKPVDPKMIRQYIDSLGLTRPDAPI